MTNEENQIFGFFRVAVNRGSCYGSPALKVELNFQTDGKVSAEISEYPKKKHALIEAAKAEKFVSKIFEIIETPEVSADLRHVEIRYQVEIEWGNFAFIGNENSGKFKAFSNEWSIDEIEEFLEYEVTNPETIERFQTILDTKPHRHALEIYRTVRDFGRKYLM